MYLAGQLESKTVQETFTLIIFTYQYRTCSKTADIPATTVIRETDFYLNTDNIHYLVFVLKF